MKQFKYVLSAFAGIVMIAMLAFGVAMVGGADFGGAKLHAAADTAQRSGNVIRNNDVSFSNVGYGLVGTTVRPYFGTSNYINEDMRKRGPENSTLIGNGYAPAPVAYTDFGSSNSGGSVNFAKSVQVKVAVNGNLLSAINNKTVTSVEFGFTYAIYAFSNGGGATLQGFFDLNSADVATDANSLRGAGNIYSAYTGTRTLNPSTGTQRNEGMVQNNSKNACGWRESYYNFTGTKLTELASRGYFWVKMFAFANNSGSGTLWAEAACVLEGITCNPREGIKGASETKLKQDIISSGSGLNGNIGDGSKKGTDTRRVFNTPFNASSGYVMDLNDLAASGSTKRMGTTEWTGSYDIRQRGPQNSNQGNALAYSNYLNKSNSYDLFGSQEAATMALQVWVNVGGDLNEAMKRGVLRTFDFTFYFGVAANIDRITTTAHGGTETFFDLSYKQNTSPLAFNYGGGGASNPGMDTRRMSDSRKGDIYSSPRNSTSGGAGTHYGFTGTANNNWNAFRSLSYSLTSEQMVNVATNGGFWVKLSSHCSGYDSTASANMQSAAVFEGLTYTTTYTEIPNSITFASNDTNKGTVSATSTADIAGLEVKIGNPVRTFLNVRNNIVSANWKANNFFVQWDSHGDPIKKLSLNTSDFDLVQTAYEARFYSIPVLTANGVVNAGSAISTAYGVTNFVPTLPTDVAEWGDANNVNITATRNTIRYNGSTALPNSVGTDYLMTADIINNSGVKVGELNQLFTITVGTATDAVTGGTPTGIVATYGDTLTNAKLPANWTWDAGQSLVVDDVTWGGVTGEQKFFASWTDPNGNYKKVENKIVTVTVSKKAGIVPVTFGGVQVFGGENITWKYGELEHSIIVDYANAFGDVSSCTADYTDIATGSRPFDEFGVRLAKGIQPTIIGNYQLKITLEGTNYVYTDIVLTFSIQKHDINTADVLVEIASGVVYGNVYNVLVEYAPVFPEYDGIVSVRYIGNGYDSDIKPVNAGTYQVEVTLSAGTYYNASVAFIVGELVIAKGVGNGSVRITGWRFDQIANPYSTTTFVEEWSGVIPTFEYAGEDGIWMSALPLDADGFFIPGDYTIRAVWAESANYLSHTATRKFTISDLPFYALPDELVDLVIEATYGDSIVIDLSEYFDDYTIEFVKVGTTETFTEIPTLVGEYIVVITVHGTDDVAETVFDSAVTIVIERATGVLTITGTDGWVYGKTGTVKTSITGTYDNSTVEYYKDATKLDNAPTAVGTYTVVVTYTGNDNYCEVTESKTLVIAKAPSTEWNGKFSEVNSDKNAIDLVIIETGIEIGNDGKHYYNGQEVQYSITRKGQSLAEDAEWYADCSFENLRSDEEYDIYMKFIGDENYNEGIVFVDTVRTKPASGALQASTGGGTKGGAPNGLLFGLIGGGVGLVAVAGLVVLYFLRRKEA
ncbi:MAG: hypothetical protein LBG88_03080 [Christensenellaceae bacterium]|jgi:hypothetical protein|nr:hypothetical protein [Christensenellaceae bacterium]